jgi:transposase
MIDLVGGGARLFPPEDKLMLLSVACQSPEVYGLKGQTHWTISTLVFIVQKYKIIKRISWTTVQKFLKGLDLKPHRMDYYLFCEDPELIEKAKYICNLYLKPPKDRVLLSYDERTAIQAKERSMIKMVRPGYPERQDCHYKRHGHTDLLAVFEVGSGQVYGSCYKRHRQIEFLGFMKKVRKRYEGKKLTIILDNLQTHKTPNVKNWLKEQNGEVEFVFTPKLASWLNQIEIWFKELNQKCLKRLSAESVEELKKKINNWIGTYNRYFAHPYNWKSEGILKKHEALAA